MMGLTLEKHLESFASICDEYCKLNSVWVSAKDALTKILSNIILCFPHYSMHDASHSQSIIRNIERILGENRIRKLTPTDTWLLLMSAYSHDIGMLVMDEELQEAWKSSDFMAFIKGIDEGKGYEDLKEYTKYFIGCVDRSKLNNWPIQEKWATIILSAEYFRRKHAEKSKEYITGLYEHKTYLNIDFSFNGFIPERLIYLLGEIAACHGREFKSIFALDYRANGIGLAEDYIHPRCVAELLRLGDLLDLDNGRFDENAVCLCGELPSTTKANRLKHKAIRHYLVRDNRIEVTGDCDNEQSYEVLSRWCQWINEEIRNLSLYWNEIVPMDFGAAFSMPRINLLLKGKKLQKDALMRFDFKNEDIFSLLEGAHIYQNKYAFFRELLQNALDATKLRLWKMICDGTYGSLIKASPLHSKLLPCDIPDDIYQSLSIRLDIKYDKEKDQFDILVLDHGIGLSENSLYNMSCVGKSWQDRAEWKKTIENMPAWLRPTGGFGLGLQSVFIITDTMDCYTKPMDDYAKHITFRSKDKGGYITYENVDLSYEYPVETKFSFSIPREKMKMFSYQLCGVFHEYLRKYDPFKHLYDENSPETILHYLLECVVRDISEPMFPVNIHLFYEDEEVIEIPCRKWVEMDSEISEDGKLINIDYGKANFSVYDIENDIELKAKFVFPRFSGRLSIRFKGVNLHEDLLLRRSMYDKYLQIAVDIEGMNVVDTLTLNREEILAEKRGYVIGILEENIKKGVEYFYRSLIDNKDNVRKCPTSWMPILGLYEKLQLTDLEDKDKMHGLFSELFNDESKSFDIKVLEKDRDNKFCYNTKSIKDVLLSVWKNKEFYLLYDKGGNHPYEKILDPLDLIEIIEEITDDDDSLDVNVVLLKETGILSLLPPYSVDALYMVKKENHIFSLIHSCINREEYMLKSLNSIAKEIYFKSLIEEPRRIISSLEEYSYLAIKRVPVELNATRMHLFDASVGNMYMMISPFNDSDIQEIKIGNTDELCEKILKRDDFINLVSYVKNNNALSDVTEEQIKKHYKRLIVDAINVTAK